jgi:cell division protein FtsB
MSAVRTTLIIMVMLLALFFLQYRLWFESGGLRDRSRLKAMQAAATLENDKLRKYNEELVFQIERIQNSQDAAEARARSELGMMKQGETFYQVVK